MKTALHRILSRPRPWAHLNEAPAEAQTGQVETADGLTLRLRHVSPIDGPPRHRPVMLLHGLAANHRGLHFRRRSLARWLAQRGHDVWLPELRGHGASQAHGYEWRIDDYLAEDLPAILEAIGEATGCERVDWVGHSMGGVLLMCYGILNPEAPIGRAVTIGSALDYKVGHTGFAALLRLRPVIERLGAIPFGTFTHLLAPALGRWPNGLETFNVWPANIEPEVVRALHARCFGTIPTSLLSSLATTFDPEGLRLQSGFRFLDHAERFDFPLLMLAGSRDQQVAVAAVEHTAELLGASATVRIHGQTHGDAQHYGHWDLILGKNAADETWPDIAEWLEKTG